MAEGRVGSAKERLWLNDGARIRLRPECHNHVRSYDFAHDRTDDGRVYRRLKIIDEFTREALTIRVDWTLNSIDMVDALTDLFILQGPPAFIRSDNGPGISAEAFACGRAVRLEVGASPLEGHCLGLAIASQIADELRWCLKHNGRREAVASVKLYIPKSISR